MSVGLNNFYSRVLAGENNCSLMLIFNKPGKSEEKSEYWESAAVPILRNGKQFCSSNLSLLGRTALGIYWSEIKGQLTGD